MLKTLKLGFKALPNFWRGVCVCIIEINYMPWAVLVHWCMGVRAQWMLGVTENNKTAQGTPLLFWLTVVIVIKSWRHCLCHFRIILYRLKKNPNLVKHTVYPSTFLSYLLIYVGLFFPLNYWQYYFTTCLASPLGIRNSYSSMMVDDLMFEFYNLPWGPVN